MSGMPTVLVQETNSCQRPRFRRCRFRSISHSRTCGIPSARRSARQTTSWRRQYWRQLDMKLYYIPDTCALAPHIAARDAGLDLELIEVKREAQGHSFGSGQDYRTVNPKDKVPALE